jgi:hypothetical protein
MKTNNQNWVNNTNNSNNEPRKTEKSQQVNQPQTKNTTDKKGTYIKDMPPIDGARPGVI